MSTVSCSSFGLCVAILIGTIAPAAANDQKIIRLEQDVRKLERIVQDQARQIEALRRQAGRDDPPQLPSETPVSGEPSRQWVNAARWDRIRPGMSELEVVDVLGLPSQIRTGEGGTRLLLYAMEIGTSGFLAGNVTVKDGKVVSVERPQLK